ncbi:MAG: aminotransferase class I/II-fold pyridoxal phosphate-dependent enzyme [Candidatus Pacebacteria bacterium]|nr:aminotransferase class I/II-fold pyridoxal phosphate-dependent enzyme [Candidatus Paceibacterota bacterium]
MMDRIEQSRKAFNKFFKDDLYGRFDDDNNIILSRGNWNDSYIDFPKFFEFCTKYSFNKHWTGYSHSLGHKNVFDSLERFVNLIEPTKKYEKSNLAVTLGNTVTIGFVFEQLKSMYPKASILTFTPYYPPIVKSINHYFKKIYFVSSLDTEDRILGTIQSVIVSKKIKILFLSNIIGVEGRLFSSSFWDKILRIIKNNNIYLVIDEGIWFDILPYPKTINNPLVIRIVSLSKKYSIPGCKIGYMLADNKFISQYYDYASMRYGGPLSVFFLLSEFIYQFEYISGSKNDYIKGLEVLNQRYDIPMKILVNLYEDFVEKQRLNKLKFETNIKVLSNWLLKNKHLIKNYYKFQGINVFIKPNTPKKSYSIFLNLLRKYKVSVMPSLCLGDESDSLLRLTFLEFTKDLKKGLSFLEKEL